MHCNIYIFIYNAWQCSFDMIRVFTNWDIISPELKFKDICPDQKKTSFPTIYRTLRMTSKSLATSIIRLSTSVSTTTAKPRSSIMTTSRDNTVPKTKARVWATGVISPAEGRIGEDGMGLLDPLELLPDIVDNVGLVRLPLGLRTLRIRAAVLH